MLVEGVCSEWQPVNSEQVKFFQLFFLALPIVCPRAFELAVTDDRLGAMDGNWHSIDAGE